MLGASLQEPGKHREQLGLVEQEGVVALVGFTSTKLTFAATALSACTTSRDSRVGNSQSLVNEIRQKRTGVFAKALASTPPCSAARSK